MSRYCCISTSPLKKDIITEKYKHLNVSVNFGVEDNSEEICIDVEDDTNEIEEINRKIASIPGFTKPIFTPNWNKITYNAGPFITEEHYVQKIKQIFNKRTGRWIPIYKITELVILSYLNYDEKDRSERFEDNFRESFRNLTGEDINDLDLSPFLAISLTLPTPDIEKYGFVVIDDRIVSLTTFATPVTSVFYTGFNEGRIKRGITARDVLVNSSDPLTAEGLTTKFFPGSCWAFRWRNINYIENLSEKYIYSFFIFKSLDLEKSYIDSDDSSSLSSSTSSNKSFLYSEGEDDNIREEDNEQLEREDEEMMEKATSRRRKHLEDDPTVKLNFDSLTDKERYLPLNYVISIADQWLAIYIALVTNFRVTYHLPKVSDEELSLVADYIAYSIEKGNKIPISCYSLLEYAAKRGV